MSAETDAIIARVREKLDPKNSNAPGNEPKALHGDEIERNEKPMPPESTTGQEVVKTTVEPSHPITEEAVRLRATELRSSVDPIDRAKGETLLSALDTSLDPQARPTLLATLAEQFPYARPDELFDAGHPDSIPDLEYQPALALLAEYQAQARTAQRAKPTNDADETGLLKGPGGPWILQMKGFFWLNSGHGSYGAPIASIDLRTALQRNLSTKLNINDHEGKMLSNEKLLHKCSQVIAGVSRSYTERRTRYDARTNRLREAALTWRDTSAADFNPAIDEWLHALAGDEYPKLAAWIAALCELDRPAPMLYTIGARNCGKTLLAVGLSQIWKCPPVDFAEAIENFNEASGRSPLFWADEGFPEKLDFQRLRKMITESSRRVNEKFKPLYDVEGFARFMVGANNNDILRYQKTGTLTREDLDAIADRLLVIRSPLTKERAEALFKGHDLTRWASDGIARHALALNKIARSESWFAPEHERMVCEAGGAEPLLLKLVAGRVPGLVKAIVQYLSKPQNAERYPAMLTFRTRWQKILVQPERLAEALGVARDRDLIEALKALSELRDGEPRRVRVRHPGQSKEQGSGDWYRVLDPELIYIVADDPLDDEAFATIAFSTEQRLGLAESGD